jgi:beta-glucosidase
MGSGPAPLSCPFCDSPDVERVAAWAGQIITSQYQCRACGSYFEAVRDDFAAPDADEHAFARAVGAVRGGDSAAAQARSLYGLLTDEERLWLLDGDTSFWPGLADFMSGGFNAHPFVHGEIARLGIPGLRFSDGPRGVVIGPGTTFPVPMARGATFDVALEEQVGDVIGREVRAAGANLYGGVCINLLRHPAWGRAQETYGDEPLHLGELGAALVRGVQRHVMATAKHYALNSMENARFTVDVTIDDATLHDVYLPHFKRVVAEGVVAIMSAYNSVNGAWAGQNERLLTGVLRDQWGFDGITVSDWVWGLRDAALSLDAGLDLEMPFRQVRARDLEAALADGRTGWPAVERAGVRLLAAQLRSYAQRSEGPFAQAIMADEAARALSRRVATRAMVLLQNDPVDGAPVLPLDAKSVRRIALIGRLATAPNVGDRGSSDVPHTPGTSTPHDGITAAFPHAEITLVEGDDPAAAAAAAAAADVAIVVAGYTAEEEGEYIPPEPEAELAALYPPLPPGFDAPDFGATGASFGVGGDRVSLRLRPVDEDIILAAARANPRTVAVIVAAGAVIVEAWRADVPAIMIMWYAGMEGGHALADLLAGAENPSGRLPFAVPAAEEQLPHFDRNATAITYERLHGQRLLDHLGAAPAFPYGFGLSYTTFAVASASCDELAGGAGTLSVGVANTGSRDGRHVVQVYGRRRSGEHAGETWLLGFRPVDVPAGRTTTVSVPFSLEPLALWSDAAQTRVPADPASVSVEVGAHARDPHAVAVDLPAA